jgi:hypothetical protein
MHAFELTKLSLELSKLSLWSSSLRITATCSINSVSTASVHDTMRTRRLCNLLSCSDCMYEQQ